MAPPPLTNDYLIKRLNSWGRPIYGWLPKTTGLKLVRLRKPAIRAVLLDAGRQSFAINRFVVRRGVGYMAHDGDPLPPQGGGRRTATS